MKSLASCKNLSSVAVTISSDIKFKWYKWCFCRKNGRTQKRGKISLIGRLQLSTERSRDEDNEGIALLRVIRVQEAIIKILKMRKRISNAQLQVELVDILRNMFQVINSTFNKLIKGKF